MPLLNTPAIVKVGTRIDRDKSPSRYDQKKRYSNISNSNFSTDRPLLSSYGTEKELKVTIRFTEKSERNENSGAVYFKDDEKRFSQQHTLKLKTLTEYNVVIDVEPAQEVSYVVLGGRKHDKLQSSQNVGGANASVYKFVWSTRSNQPTDRKYRTILPCIIKFKPYKELRFNMLAKFYSNTELAHYTGEELHFLDLDCRVGTGKDKSTKMYPPIRFN